MSDHTSDQFFRSGQYEKAAARLNSGLADHGEKSRDALLYLLDIGLSLHSAGKYEESNVAFLKADKLAEVKDYTSISAEAATLITTDNLKDYAGEDFEKVLINTYLGMNYALMGNLEDSLVEFRKVNQKLYLMTSMGKRKYKQNAFARYLSAILYETERNYNDAYVDYKKAAELVPDFPGLGLDLWRCASELSLPDEMDQWDEQYHLTRADHKRALQAGTHSKMGEVIVLYENGISPVKRPNPIFAEIPKFYPRFNPVKWAQVEISSPATPLLVEEGGMTQPLEDIESTAIHNLDEKYAGMIARKLAGVVVKESLAYTLERETHNPLLGLAARLAMYASDQADVRSWNLLPRDLQILRIPLKPGSYQVRIRPEGRTTQLEKTIEVLPGKRNFLNFRYTP